MYKWCLTYVPDSQDIFYIYVPNRYQQGLIASQLFLIHKLFYKFMYCVCIFQKDSDILNRYSHGQIRGKYASKTRKFYKQNTVDLLSFYLHYVTEAKSLKSRSRYILTILCSNLLTGWL